MLMVALSSGLTLMQRRDIIILYQYKGGSSVKKSIAVLLVGLLLTSLAGCGDDITLDKRENDLVAEYIAGVMLKYSYDNEWKYTKVSNALNKYQSNGTIPPSAVTGTGSRQENSTAASSKPSGNQSASVNVYAAMSDALGLTGADISFKSYTVGTRYPMDEYAVCFSAKDGYKIVTLEFNIKNNSGSDMVMNTASKQVTMKLDIGGKSVVQSASMLYNDIISLNKVKLAAGDSYTAVACFQVPEANASSTDITCTVYNGGQSLGTISNIK